VGSSEHESESDEVSESGWRVANGEEGADSGYMHMLDGDPWSSDPMHLLLDCDAC
jgi:hypothetical protein